MKSTPDNRLSGGTVPDPASFEETLRLIAHVPVPVGLEERVYSALSAAPRNGKLLSWPHALDSAPFSGASAWLRAAAAAAIVFVVAGGGWGVYRRVQHPSSKVIAMPAAQPTADGGFSAAGAIRKSHTVKGPVLVQPAAKPGRKKGRKKLTARPAASTSRQADAARPNPAPAVSATAAGR